MTVIAATNGHSGRRFLGTHEPVGSEGEHVAVDSVIYQDVSMLLFMLVERH